MERETSPSSEIVKAQGPEASFTLGQLSKAAAYGDEGKVQSLKEQLARDFPDQMEMVEAIADFPRYLAVQEKLDAGVKNKVERMAFIREQAEYNFLLTHMVSGVADRRTFMRFWDALGRMAQAQKKRVQYVMMRAGVLSQVATLKIFQKLGQHPELSHPKHDQYNAIDLWEEGTPVQIKSGREETPLWIEVDRMGPTNIAVQAHDQQRLVSSKVMQDIERFTYGLKAYEASTGQRITGHLLVLPGRSYDEVTGEPTPEIIDFVRKNIGRNEEREIAA